MNVYGDSPNHKPFRKNLPCSHLKKIVLECYKMKRPRREYSFVGNIFEMTHLWCCLKPRNQRSATEWEGGRESGCPLSNGKGIWNGITLLVAMAIMKQAMLCESFDDLNSINLESIPLCTNGFTHCTTQFLFCANRAEYQVEKIHNYVNILLYTMLSYIWISEDAMLLTIIIFR